MEDLYYYAEKTVTNCLGHNDKAITKCLINCLDDGLDKAQTTKKLTALTNESVASNITSKLFNMMGKSDGDVKRVKMDPNPVPTSAVLNEAQIKEMMANAQRMIEARKKQLNLAQSEALISKTNASFNKSSSSAVPVPGNETAVKAAELHARIQAALAANPQLNSANQSKPTPLLIDELGRTIDSTGKTIQIPQPMPTLKANIRARKREEFTAALKDRTVGDQKQSAVSSSQSAVTNTSMPNRFYDPRLDSITHPAARNTSAVVKRAFKFHEKGKYEQMAQKLRAKARLEQLQNEISQAVKRTGIISAAKLALIVPKKDPGSTKDIPACEWWDSCLLKDSNYDNVTTFENFNFGCLDTKRITNLVQHPMQMKRQKFKKSATEIVVHLTQKERKKLRRQNRREIWLEKQEKIRLGLEPPPEPKLKMSNLMRVLGKEAILDPTKIEAHVRAQMARRAQQHEQANEERKLTPSERKAKRDRKLQEDTSDEVHVAVFRLRTLHNPAKKFKVEANANQLFMTGFVALYKDINVVVVEGGPKQLRKFKHLMLDRIKWQDDKLPSTHQSHFITAGTEPITASTSNNQLQHHNLCELVWEGIVKKRAFGPITFKLFPSEGFAREAFAKHGVEQYWNLAYSHALLENNENL